MKENAPQSILDVRGNRRQFLEFVAGAGTGAIAGLLAHSQETHANEASLLPIATQDAEDHTTAEEVAPLIGGAIGAAGGLLTGTVEGQYRLNQLVNKGKVTTKHDKQTAAMTIGPAFMFGGAALGGGLGASIGYGAVKLVRRIF